MERFTNNIQEFIDQIKLELSGYELKDNYEYVYTYVEISQLLIYAYSYICVVDKVNSTCFLIRKEWNAMYDHSRFNKGIYNLDRLAIVEKEIEFKSEYSSLVKSINWNKIDTVEFNGIILDGLMCELRVSKPDKILNWNIDQEMNNELAQLITEIRSWEI